MRVNLEISVGELIDRIAILELKRARIASEGARAELSRQLEAARDERDRVLQPSPDLLALTAELEVANRELWRAEDELRECERNADFGARFVNLARSVYKTNDRRASLKRRIDELVGSPLREYKLYPGTRGES